MPASDSAFLTSDSLTSPVHTVKTFVYLHGCQGVLHNIGWHHGTPRRMPSGGKLHTVRLEPCVFIAGKTSLVLCKLAELINKSSTSAVTWQAFTQG